MAETKKPKFHHIAVNGKKSKTGQKYAKDLTDAMNKLVQDGYAVQLNEYEHFTVILGVLVDEQVTRSAAPPVLHFVDKDAATPPSPRTMELLRRFQTLADGMPFETFIVEVKKQATALTRGFNAEELVTARKEVERSLVEHLGEAHEHDCLHTRLMRVVIETLHGAVQLQLQ